MADTVDSDDLGRQTDEVHESYGQIMWSTPTCTPGTTCHGSYTLHGRYVEVTVQRGAVQHHLAKDWHHSRGPILLRFRMSLTQWARFIATPNLGDGVPCTLEIAEGKRMADPPIRDIIERHARAYRQEHEDSAAMVLTMLAEAQALLDNPKPSRKWVDSLCSCLTKIHQNLTTSSAWRQEQFGKFVENQLDLAKAELEAHLGMVLQRHPQLAAVDPAVLLLAGPDVGFEPPADEG